MRKRAVVCFMGLCLSVSAVQAADIEAGKTRAQACVGCHGTDGRAANPEWPNLAGQNATYIINQLKAFKSGNRKNELMSPMAQSLSDVDVENVAGYFSSLSSCK
ncbi:MAG TPA: cytochrome c [Gammaproteobacteria bacterium]|nr:cytochrome c [Gammaproteobacteria bacterium]